MNGPLQLRSPMGLLLGSMLALATTAGAQQEFRDGRIRHVEPGVTIQRATEAGAEEAGPNMPFLPGDRVWTDEAGRVEFQFAEGSVLRLDSRSKLDYVTHDEGRGGERIVLRLWSGGLFLHGEDRGAGFEVETPGGLVEAGRRGIVRVDTDSGEVRVSVYEGQATLDSGRRSVTVSEGERSYARRGESPEDPRPFDRGEADEFARWDEEREAREARAAASRRYLPEDVSPYASDFETYGAWYYQNDIGNVWRPYVAAGWRPYWDGRWIWSAYGWTWVPNEPWGWAPSHYGRWGHSLALGWYWIPGASWSPAWVSWAIGGGYVGWCPLGYRDRPVVVRQDRFRGYAVPRGSLAVESERAAWVYARQTDLSTRDPRRRLETAPVPAGELRVIDSPRARLTRDLREVDERAVPRHVSTRPYPGDTVPELRTDPATTIPFPVARRHTQPRDESEDSQSQRAGARGQRGGARHEQGVTVQGAAGEGERAVGRPGRPWAEGEAEQAAAVHERTRPSGETTHPTDARSRPVGRPQTEAGRPQNEVRPRRLEREGDGHDGDGGREAVRRFYRPLDGAPSQPREGQAEPAPPPGHAGWGGPRVEQAPPPDHGRPEAHRPEARNPHGSDAGRRSPPPQAQGRGSDARAVPRPRKEKEH